MSKTTIVLKHEFSKTLKSKTFIILTIALPLILILGMGIYQGVVRLSQPKPPKETKIGYVDGTGIFRNYSEQQSVKFVSFTSETDARTSLLQNDISEYFVIPTDYVSTGQIIRYTLSRELEPSGTSMSAIRNFLLSNMLGGDVDPQILERVKMPMWLNSTRIEKSGEIAPNQDVVSTAVVPMLFAVIFMVSVFFASGFLFQSVTEEKENRVIEILLSSVSSRQLMVGKILGLGLAGLTQIAVWFVAVLIFSEFAPSIIPALSSLHIPLSLVGWALLYFILGYLLFSSLYAGVGSIGATSKEAQGWSMIFVLPAILPYYFSYFIMSQPEGVLSRVLSLFPLTSPMAVMMRLPPRAISAWEIAVSLVLLVGSILLAMWLVSRVFRVFLLMYGKKPAIRDILRYARKG